MTNSFMQVSKEKFLEYIRRSDPFRFNLHVPFSSGWVYEGGSRISWPLYEGVGISLPNFALIKNSPSDEGRSIGSSKSHSISEWHHVVEEVEFFTETRPTPRD